MEEELREDAFMKLKEAFCPKNRAEMLEENLQHGLTTALSAAADTKAELRERLNKVAEDVLLLQKGFAMLQQRADCFETREEREEQARKEGKELRKWIEIEVQKERERNQVVILELSAIVQELAADRQVRKDKEASGLQRLFDRFVSELRAEVAAF